jgi:DNA-directed RNA polymerase alpha subunit
MKSREHRLWHIQITMHEYDLDSRKFVAKWLLKLIKLQEMDFTTINAGIEDIGLSNRAYNVLKENNVTSLQQLLILVADGVSIPVLKGAGKIVAQEIEKKALQFQNTYIFKDKNEHMRSPYRTK